MPDSTVVYDNILTRASVRNFEDREVPRELIERAARAGQQAPFTGQMYSFIVTTDTKKRRSLVPLFGPMVERAPVFVLICVDFRKLEKFIAYKGRANRADDLGLLFLGIQDAAYAGENFILAAQAEGLGSCFLGAAPFVADALIDIFGLPERVYPLVGLVLGYPAESPPPRPRIPLATCLFWDEYHDLGEDEVAAAMKVMDAGLIREGYYARLNAKLPIQVPQAGDRGRGEDARRGSDDDAHGAPDGDAAADPVGYDEYGWSEHVSRKYGVLGREITSGLFPQLARQGIRLGR